MKKKTTEPSKKKGKKKKSVKIKETPVWGDPDCKSFSYHPVTGKPLNPFPNLREQESIIPFFSERVEQKRQELELKKKKEKEEVQAGSLYRPINISSFGGNKEENQEEAKLKPKIVDLHRFEWMNKESWIRCRLRQRGWSYNDMFLNVQCSWTLLRLKMEIKKHLFEGSLLTDNILIYKNDLSKKDQKKSDDDDTEDDDSDNSPSSNNDTNNDINSITTDKTKNDDTKEDEFAIFSKNQECSEPLYKLFPRIRNLKSIGNMIPFEEGFTNCDDNEYPILIVSQRPIHIYEPPPPPPPPPKVEKKTGKKKKGTGTKKKTTTPAKKKKIVKKKKKEVEEIPHQEEIDPNAPHEPNDSELLDMEDENVQIYREPNKILKNPDQYLYVFFDVNSPFVPS
ncbi:hypothetical protein PIROE2DRAFT_3166 [Piromyces sp. E2]|nr:hypothetical protein PIROE2DRAFT_3166 [Piromyces sp. E2]|eukprot:OUM68939.1 hypothetical protein PIROE2DRAFT_3166 [Piromyces sp. E2]